MSPVQETIGTLFDAGKLEAATIAMLREWLPTYVAEVARQNDREADSIAPIKSWAVMSEYERWPEQHLPALIVAAPGITGDTERDGDGYYRAAWALEVSVTVGHANAPEARKLAQMYAAAVRGALLQRRRLDEELLVTDWVDEAYGDVPNSQRRTIVAAANVFTVEHDRIVTWQGGPATDEAPGPTEWPEITETDVEVEHRDEE